MTEPVPSYNNVSWWGNFGEYGFLTKLRSEQLRDFGPALSPQSAFNLLQGVETLPQRMDAHLANAKKVVDWLVEDARIAYVNSQLPGMRTTNARKNCCRWALGLYSPSG